MDLDAEVHEGWWHWWAGGQPTAAYALHGFPGDVWFCARIAILMPFLNGSENAQFCHGRMTGSSCLVRSVTLGGGLPGRSLTDGWYFRNTGGVH